MTRHRRRRPKPAWQNFARPALAGLCWKAITLVWDWLTNSVGC